ncbi:DUF1877 family protein [Streptomyces sp. NPDC046909]|uniref:DUF1877 family protein n=1 Tax=Streptomyces sp. NPDC046909 TaxID=3155617 RepID=UPI0033CAB22F
MSMYFHFRAIRPAALRNSPAWLEKLFEDDWDAVRERIGRHREEVLDKGYLDHELLYAGTEGGDSPAAQVVLGGRPLPHPDPALPPFVLLTAAQAGRVAAYLAAADFDDLWLDARDLLLKSYGGQEAEPEIHGAFAAAHRDLTAFYGQTAHYGDAVVKWLVP